jgi:hypothetical protein
MNLHLDIDPQLVTEAETTARTGGPSVRELVEEGLRHVLSERGARGPRIEDFATGGHALDGRFQTGGWKDIRECVYGAED